MLYKELKNLDERKELGLNGPGNYRVINNKVYTRAIEINAVRHCNLSCRGCSHSSPIVQPQEYSARNIKNDLLYLSQFLHCEFVRLLGGEPLLHSNILEVLKSIKNSNISDKICLVTNGILLDKLTDEEIQYIDKIEISLYPLNKQLLYKIRNNAKRIVEKGTKVRILEYSEFREAIVKENTSCENLKQLVYDTCQIAHNWRCITIDNDLIYRCPQSMIYSETNNDYSDSLRISELKTIFDLLIFLENNHYLNSCSKCLGSIGEKFEHQQVNKKYWNDFLPEQLKDGIDFTYAKKLIEKNDFQSDCMKRKRLN